MSIEFKKYAPMLALFHAFTKFSNENVFGKENGLALISVVVLNADISTHNKGRMMIAANRISRKYFATEPAMLPARPRTVLLY